LKAVVKFYKNLSIDSAFTRMTSEIENIWSYKNFLNYIELVFRELTP